MNYQSFDLIAQAFQGKLNDEHIRNINLSKAENFDSLHAKAGLSEFFEQSALKPLFDLVNVSLGEENVHSVFIEWSSKLSTVGHGKYIVFTGVMENGEKPSLDIDFLEYVFPYNFLTENEFPLYYRKDFFIGPERATAHCSKIHEPTVAEFNVEPLLKDNVAKGRRYLVLADLYSKIDDARSNINAKQESIKYLDHRQNGRKYLITEHHFPISVEKFDQDALDQENRIAQIPNSSLEQGHSDWHALWHQLCLSDGEVVPRSYFLSIPIIGSNADLNHGSNNFVGQGGCSVLIYAKNEIDQVQFPLLANDIDTLLKTATYNYTYAVGKELAEKTERHALNSAVAQIFARNFAHNIGSHVAIRTTNRMVKDRLAELYPDRDRYDHNLLDWLDHMKGKLDNFEIHRNEYLAEYKLPARNMFLYKDILLPFCESALLMDNLAASENIDYSSDRLSNRLKVRVFMGKEEISAEYPLLQSGSDIMVCYPHHFPYLIDPIATGNKTIPFDVAFGQKKIVGAQDVEICLPSEHALYSILENFIRNSAKHNNDRLNEGEGQDLNINFQIMADNDADFYTVQLFDNVSVVSAEQVEKFRQNIGASLLDSLGNIDKRHLGIADMKINAHLLRSQEDISDQNIRQSIEILIADPDCADLCPSFKLIWEPGESFDKAKHYRFGYRFKLTKPKKIIWIGEHERHSVAKEEDLRKCGIVTYPTIGDFQKVKATSIATFDFAILEKDAVKELKNDDSGFLFDQLLTILPHRVLINCPAAELAAHSVLNDLLAARRIQAVSDRLLIPASKEKCYSEDVKYQLQLDCWKNWLDRWLADNKFLRGKKGAHLYVYLEDDNQAISWTEHIVDLELPFRVDFLSQKNQRGTSAKAKDNRLIMDDEALIIFYDHHARGYEKGLAQKVEGFKFIKDGAYLQFDKGSNDFGRLFSPSNSALQNLQQLCKASEAGFTSVLIVDERIAEKINLRETDSNISKISNSEDSPFYAEFLKEGTYADLLNAGNTFLVTALNENVRLSEKRNFDLRFENGIVKIFKPAFIESEIPHYDALFIHRTFLNQMLDFSLNDRERNAFMHRLNQQFSRVVVVSGGGFPHALNVDIKFQSLAALTKNFEKYQSKISLINLL